MPAPEYDDLTVDDHLVQSTEKDSPGSTDTVQPELSQDPNWVPDSIVDENGQPA